MPRDTFVSKAQINDGEVYLELQWKPSDHDLFQLRILGEDCNWTGTFSNELAKKYMSDLYQDEEEYHMNTQQCLTGENGYKLEISVNDDGVTGMFRWKKKYEELVQDQGSMPIHRDNTPNAKETLIDSLIDSNKELTSTISLLNRKIEEIIVDLEKCKTDLEIFIDIKSSIEADLYGKFVQLLNTKKQRIQLLENQLKNYMN